MGTRFRRKVKIAPGLSLNVNKGSLGLTAGVKGAHVSVNTKGQRTTSVGIPGTGLSYVDVKKTSKQQSEIVETQCVKKKKKVVPIVLIVLGVLSIKTIGIILIAIGAFLAIKKPKEVYEETDRI